MSVCGKVRGPRAAEPVATPVPLKNFAARVFRECFDAGREVARGAVAENAFVRKVTPQDLADIVIVYQGLHCSSCYLAAELNGGAFEGSKHRGVMQFCRNLSDVVIATQSNGKKEKRKRKPNK
jgi:hypothetical protein